MRTRHASSDAAALDDSTVERLLSGQLPVDDAPPEYQGVAALLEQAAQPGPARVTNHGVVDAMAACLAPADAPGVATRRRMSMTRQRIVQLAAAGTVGAMSLFGGLAAANALPGAAQSVASDMLGTLGVNVPNPDSHAGTHPDTRGQSTSHDQNATPGSSGQGSTISNLAHSTTETGVNKGATISSVASNGQSQAGEHGSPTDVPSSDIPSQAPPFSTPPVSTPPTSGPPSSAPPVATPPVSSPPVTTPSQSQSGLGHRP